MSSTVARISQALTDARARRATRRLGAVTFDEATGQVCDNRCRATAQDDRNRSAAAHGAF